MSWDIDVHLPDGRHLELNWLRNPFGLCDFAEDNVGNGSMSLWHVCNDFADDIEKFDRARFQEIVHEYWCRLAILHRGYFCFSFRSYVQFVRNFPEAMHLDLLDFMEQDWAWVGPRRHPTEVRIDVQRFSIYGRNADVRTTSPTNNQFGWDAGSNVLDWYRKWFQELHEIASAVQDPNATITISN
jgi:hypothetical protein